MLIVQMVKIFGAGTSNFTMGNKLTDRPHGTLRSRTQRFGYAHGLAQREAFRIDSTSTYQKRWTRNVEVKRGHGEGERKKWARMGFKTKYANLDTYMARYGDYYSCVSHGDLRVFYLSWP